MAEKNLKYVIDAVDNASKNIINVSKQLEALQNSTNNAGKATANVASSVFTGVAAWDLLKKGIGITTDFLKESIISSIEADAQMVQAKTNIENAGLAYSEVGGTIEAYAKKTMDLGVDNEAVILSTSRFIQVVKNENDAMKLNALALDLSRNKGISLEDATISLLGVLAGNNRIVKQYGIELSDSATAGKALDEIQKKVKDSAKNFADTTAGKLEILNNRWAEMKEIIGDEIKPTLDKLADGAIGFSDWETVAKAIGMAFNALANDIGTVLDFLGMFKAPLIEILRPILEIKKNLIDLGILKDVIKVDTSQQTFLESLANDATRSSQMTKLVVKDMAAYKKSLSVGLDELNSFKSMDEYLDSIRDKSEKNAEAVKKVAEAFKNLKDTLTDVKTKGIDILQSLQDKIKDLNTSLIDINKEYVLSQQETAKSIGQAFVDQETKILEAEKELQAMRLDMGRKSQDRINADAEEKKNISTQEAELIKLNASLSTETDAEKIASIKEQIAEKQLALEEDKKAYDAAVIQRKQESMDDTQMLADKENAVKKEKDALSSLQALKLQYLNEYNIAHDLSLKTDFERTILELQAKQAQYQAEYDLKVKKINDEILAEQKKQETITGLLAQQTENINAFLDSAKAKTEESINAQIESWKKLGETISRISEGKAVATTTSTSWSAPSGYEKISGPSQLVNYTGVIKQPNTSTLWGKRIPGRASGGSVSSNQGYIVGENGPEYFKPKVNGDIIPNRKLGGGVIINIIVKDNQLLDKDSGRKIADAIFKDFKLKTNFS